MAGFDLVDGVANEIEPSFNNTTFVRRELDNCNLPPFQALLILEVLVRSKENVKLLFRKSQQGAIR